MVSAYRASTWSSVGLLAVLVEGEERWREREDDCRTGPLESVLRRGRTSGSRRVRSRLELALLTELGDRQDVLLCSLAGLDTVEG